MAKKLGIFKGIGEARVFKDANYLRPGHFWCRIDNCKIDENRKKRTFAAIEMTVVHILDDSTTHKVGEEVTHMVMEDSEYFLAEILKFIGSVAGVDINTASEEEKEEAAETVFGGDNPLGGMLVEVFSRNQVTKENKDFTKISYRGEVDPKIAIATLPSAIKERFFPNNYLENLIEAQKNAA